jgi:NADH-quinone oxidoreductase subunit F
MANGLSKEEKQILKKEREIDSTERDIKVLVDRVVEEQGTSADRVIPILQAIQGKYNYLPEAALERVCEITDITVSNIYSISTFYSQFRHKQVGRHIIRVCVGTACHVKGAKQVFDAFKRELNIEEHEDSDAEGLFTIDKVACLGCCTIAPVVQIDGITYGHLTTDKVPGVIKDFLSSEKDASDGSVKIISGDKPVQGEIRVGLGSCCVASGSSRVKEELEKTIGASKINVDVKQVGCVGICNQVPML